MYSDTVTNHILKLVVREKEYQQDDLYLICISVYLDSLKTRVMCETHGVLSCVCVHGYKLVYHSSLNDLNPVCNSLFTKCI